MGTLSKSRDTAIASRQSPRGLLRSAMSRSGGKFFFTIRWRGTTLSQGIPIHPAVENTYFFTLEDAMKLSLTLLSLPLASAQFRALAAAAPQAAAGEREAPPSPNHTKQ